MLPINNIVGYSVGGDDEQVKSVTVKAADIVDPFVKPTSYVFRLDDIYNTFKPPATTEKVVTISSDISSFFDDVFCISLPRRTDRRDIFWKNIASCNWPFKIPVIYPAMDGGVIPARKGWKGTPGALGCLESHRAVMKIAATRNRPVLILEDDVVFVKDFTARVRNFLWSVPSDWDCLMLGGDHGGNPTSFVKPDILKCSFTYNTHAYCIRGSMLRAVLKDLETATEPVDVVLAQRMYTHKVYAPTEWLAGQDTSFSDVQSEMRYSRHI